MIKNVAITYIWLNKHCKKPRPKLQNLGDTHFKAIVQGHLRPLKVNGLCGLSLFRALWETKMSTCSVNKLFNNLAH